jgi:hypothetical protein
LFSSLLSADGGIGLNGTRLDEAYLHGVSGALNTLTEAVAEQDEQAAVQAAAMSNVTDTLASVLTSFNAFGYRLSVVEANTELLKSLVVTQPMPPMPPPTPPQPPLPVSWLSNPVAGTSVFASSVAGGYSAHSAFDGDSSTFWLSDLPAPCGTQTWPQWLQISFPSSLAITQYTLRGHSECNEYCSQSPSEWTLRGSNDGYNWTVIDSQTGQTNMCYCYAPHTYQVNVPSFFFVLSVCFYWQ